MYTSITIFRNFLLKIQYFDGKFRIIGPPERCGSNSKALSAVKLVMISRKSFNFDLILHKKTTWGVKFVALFKLVRFCLGGFCTSTRTSCQALDSPLIFWFLPQEKLQIDWLSLHSSEKRALRSTFWPRETLQNLLCLCKKKTQVVFFRFSFQATLSFTLMNALVYVDIDQGIHKGKTQSCSKWKTKKTTWVFFLYKYRKFWSISSEFKLEHKKFILEVCHLTS